MSDFNMKKGQFKKHGKINFVMLVLNLNFTMINLFKKLFL